MKRSLLLSLVVGLGCEPETPDEPTAPVVPSGISMVRKAGAAPASECPAGGVALQTGIDQNADGVLDDSEIDGTYYVCHGVSTLVAVTEVPAGDACAAGGLSIATGADDGEGGGDPGDGVLHPDEVDDEKFVCNGNGCSVRDETDGAQIVCDDGTHQDVKDGANGEPGVGVTCTAGPHPEDVGAYVIACSDGSTVTVHDGAPGTPGEPGTAGPGACSVAENDQGNAVITCPSGEVEVSDGESCEVTHTPPIGDEAGYTTVTCPDSTVRIYDAEPCAVADTENGVQISCPNGSVVELADGADGASGNDGVPGSPGQPGSPGGPGAPGSSCSATETPGRVTISCGDGSSVSFAVPYCGNSMVETGEECDDGDPDNTNGCGTDCRLPPSFNADVKPRYVAHCSSCHTGGTGDNCSGGANACFDRYEDLASAEDSSACSGGTQAQCTLTRIRNSSMPQGGMSSSDRTALADLIETWIATGMQP